MELLIGSDPEGVLGAGDHCHLGPGLQPVDGICGQGRHPGLVLLLVGHPAVVHALPVADPTKLNPDLL